MLAARVPLHCIFAPSGCGVGVPGLLNNPLWHEQRLLYEGLVRYFCCTTQCKTVRDVPDIEPQRAGVCIPSINVVRAERSISPSASRQTSHPRPVAAIQQAPGLSVPAFEAPQQPNLSCHRTPTPAEIQSARYHRAWLKTCILEVRLADGMSYACCRPRHAAAPARCGEACILGCAGGVRSDSARQSSPFQSLRGSVQVPPTPRV